MAEKGYSEKPIPEERAYPAYPERSYEEARIKDDEEREAGKK